MSTTAHTAAAAVSPLAAFRHPVFALVWTVTLISNVGSWMFGAASAWLMTSLNPDPLIVSLVQAASSAPIFLFALPAGAFADIFDKRKYLIVIEGLTTAVSAVYAAIVWLGLASPTNVLLFTFVIGTVWALSGPAWQAVVPQLVPKHDLPAAITANSVGVNLSRALGPALGGAAIAGLSIVAPFWINAAANLGVNGALLWWRPQTAARKLLPAERFGRAMGAGLRYARHSPPLRATLIRAAGFFLFASAYWALLPLVARVQIHNGPEVYGVLLGAIGMGSILGSFALNRLKALLGPDRLATLGTLGTILALGLYGAARDPWMGGIASLIAGETVQR